MNEIDDVLFDCMLEYRYELSRLSHLKTKKGREAMMAIMLETPKARIDWFRQYDKFVEDQWDARNS